MALLILNANAHRLLRRT